MATGESGKKNQRWILPAVGFMIAVSLGVSFGPDVLKHFREKRITENGVQAEARIVSLVDTGNRYNSNPEVQLVLEVQPADGKPFRASATRVLTPLDLQSYTKGATVIVMYDPEKPGEAVVLGVKADTGR